MQLVPGAAEKGLSANTCDFSVMKDVRYVTLDSGGSVSSKAEIPSWNLLWL
ncbi:unnamed protein product, partial [Clonostachys byssicola]